ncbi:hypothetical protein BSL78_01485 [Apostichopus japonicus]|uniref:Uncharacterized protein n=1 Tax=Stichopus japonicus TaxID=307972 RepID=A0A2G8LN01_STIJA|nr:hypothetical protein BSL78_01485 [Apostichopus japonicus]
MTSLFLYNILFYFLISVVLFTDEGSLAIEYERFRCALNVVDSSKRSLCKYHRKSSQSKSAITENCAVEEDQINAVDVTCGSITKKGCTSTITVDSQDYRGQGSNSLTISNNTNIECRVSCSGSSCFVRAHIKVVQAVTEAAKLNGSAGITVTVSATLKSSTLTASSNDPTGYKYQNGELGDKDIHDITSTSSKMANTTNTYVVADASSNLVTINVTLLCIFGFFIVLCSFLAGNARYIMSKCRIITREQPVYENRPSSQPIDEMELQVVAHPRNGIGQATQSCKTSRNVIVNFDRQRSHSYYDRSILINSSRSPHEQLLSTAQLPQQRKLSVSDGGLYHNTSHPLSTSALGGDIYTNETTYSVYRDPLCGRSYDPGVGQPYDRLSTRFDTDINVYSRRHRLDSEFTYGRDRFLSNVMKSKPYDSLGNQRRNDSRLSVHRETIFPSATQWRSLRRKSRQMNSIHRRTRSRRLPSDVTQRFTHCMSLLSLGACEDVFSNEHIYESISLDDIRPVVDGESEVVCRYSSCAKRVTHEEQFPMLSRRAKAPEGSTIEHIGEIQTTRTDEGSRSKYPPPLYIPLAQESHYQRRCSLPSPTEMVVGQREMEELASHTDDNRVSLILSSHFRSEGHIPMALKFFDIC